MASRGESLETAVSVGDFERIAAARLDEATYGYFAGGSGDELTLRENVSAFGRWRLRPRVAVDVDEVSTRVDLLGSPAAMPIGVAPVALQRLVDSEGELAMARAAEAVGAVYCHSTLATERPGAAAAAAPAGRRLFQVYAFRDRGVTHALIEEALESGYEGLALTLDSPRAGNRERDRRTGFAIPGDLGVPSLDAILGPGSAPDMEKVFSLVDASFDWDDLAALASECGAPILAKGVMTGEDAVRAEASGAAGVIVSNHGARQLDRVPATLDVLEEIAESLGGRLPVLLDGGVRRGIDVAIAIALGAGGVLVGRPAIWGLAAGGREGVVRVLSRLRDELELTLALLGCPAPDELDRSFLRRAG